MNGRSKAMTVAAVLLTVVMVVGITVIAASNAGTQNDPLVALSYLSDKFRPQVMTELKADAAKTGEELTRRFDEKISELKSSGGGQTSSPGASNVFTLVTIEKGKTLTCSVGTEIMLRVGTATAEGSSPALVDSTAGATLAAGAQLTVNHMYMVTIEGNGFKATADTVKVMIRGGYKVN